MKVFCMTNCWTNYDMVASAIIQQWIKRGLKTNGITDYEIKSFLDTPYLGYYAVGSGLAAFSAAYQCYGTTPTVPGTGISQQFAVYIWIISIAAVVLAHIQWADVVFIENNSVTTLPMMAEVASLASSLGKQIVYWRDDDRMQWGTTNDPISIGVLPSAYKYIWNAAANQAQDSKFNAQQSNNNPIGVSAKQGSNTNICAHFMSQGTVLSDKWRTIARAIYFAKQHTQEDHSFPGSRTSALAQIGKNIVNFIEVVKPANTYYKEKFGVGWTPAPPPAYDPKIGNVTLYYDCFNVILASVAPNLLDKAIKDATGVTDVVTGFPDDEIEFITTSVGMSGGKCPDGYVTSYFPGDPNCPNGWCGCSAVPHKSTDVKLSRGTAHQSRALNVGMPFSANSRLNAASRGMPVLLGALGHQLSNKGVTGLSASRPSVQSGPTRFPSYPAPDRPGSV